MCLVRTGILHRQAVAAHQGDVPRLDHVCLEALPELLRPTSRIEPTGTELQRGSEFRSARALPRSIINLGAKVLQLQRPQDLIELVHLSISIKISHAVTVAWEILVEFHSSQTMLRSLLRAKPEAALSFLFRPLSTTSSSHATPTLPPFSHVPEKYTGPSADEVLRLRRQHLSPCESDARPHGGGALTACAPAALSLHFKKPLMIVEGKMQYLFDEKGRRYLDVRKGYITTMYDALKCRCPSRQAFAGIVTVSVGHCHPQVIDAIIQQTKLLQHTTTIYLNNQVAEYAKELADKMPGDLKVSSACIKYERIAAGSETFSFDVISSEACLHEFCFA